MTPDEYFAHLVSEGDLPLDLFDRCVARLPGKVFLHYGEDDTRLTFAETARQTDRLAAGLVAMGVEPGDRVCVFTRNALVSALSMLAIWRAGAVFAPVNFNYAGRLLAYQMRDTMPAAVITDLASVPLFDAVADEIGPQRYILHRPVPGAHDYDAALAPGGGPAGQSTVDFADMVTGKGPGPRIARHHADAANIVYTSGTTGPAKGVVHPFRWINQYTFCLRQLMGEDDVVYCDLPLYHVGGAFFDLARALWRGNTVALWDRFSPTRFWERICASGATSCILVDVMVPWLMSAPPSDRDRANPLRHAHMQPLHATHHEVARRFGIEFVTVGFGQTETGLGFCGLVDELGNAPAGASSTPPELYRGLSRDATRAAATRFGIMTVPGDAALPKGFMGQPSPLLEATILDPDDNRCAPGDVGQLAFRPRYPHLMLKEYFNKPETNLAAFRNCWFHTGDAARVTDEGLTVFVDRLGGVLRVRGEKFSSHQVEDLVAAHPAIRACAAVPIPAREGDEDDIALFVELRDGAELSEEALARHVAGMPKFMRPLHLRIVPALPLTPTNKIEKYKLRKMLLDEIEAANQAAPGSRPG